jgi:2,4-dienoyl-CoA reductase-like NADH-dependent reductase (Old Yellow Enzyme family)
VATGRASHIDTSGFIPVTSSVDPNYIRDETIRVSTPQGWAHPSEHRALEIGEIRGIIDDYRKAAERAKAAGFDGVEIHAGNGYLPDQFLQDGVNKRTDAYGGSIENRSRFLLEVVGALVEVWGANRVGVRIAPVGRWNGMSDSDSDALFDYVAAQLNRFGLAYLHIIEPRIRGNTLVAEGQPLSRLNGCGRSSRERSSRPEVLSLRRPRRPWKAGYPISLLLESILWPILICRSESGWGCHSILMIARRSTRSMPGVTQTIRSTRNFPEKPL